jgi:hypothetical protein
MLSVVTLSVIMLNVIYKLFRLSVVMLNVVTPSVIKLNVIYKLFMAKCCYAECRYAECH